MAQARPQDDRGRSPLSTQLYAVDRWASRPVTVLVVLVLDAAWVVFTLVTGTGASERIQTVFQSLVAALTMAMVFVIQHTQARQQAATHRKLDEILLALPDADNALLTLEHASDDELRATRHNHGQIRQAALDEQAAEDGSVEEG
jgi:low affinity Fe/Cu permease